MAAGHGGAGGGVRQPRGEQRGEQFAQQRGEGGDDERRRRRRAPLASRAGRGMLTYGRVISRGL
ncbi:hypothetical protein [Actinomadura kijaniata]|uniref:hypothetical protein n=1 Tax=Actinomadura kijaniata TaxID=46161 RepID=UPI0031DBA4E3